MIMFARAHAGQAMPSALQDENVPFPVLIARQSTGEGIFRRKLPAAPYGESTRC